MMNQANTSTNFQFDKLHVMYREQLEHTAHIDERMARIGEEIAASDLRQATLMSVLHNIAAQHFPMLTEEEWSIILGVAILSSVDEFLLAAHNITSEPNVNLLATIIHEDGSHSIPERIANLTPMQEFTCLIAAKYFWTKDGNDSRSITEDLALISGLSVDEVFLIND